MAKFFFYILTHIKQHEILRGERKKIHLARTSSLLEFSLFSTPQFSLFGYFFSGSHDNKQIREALCGRDHKMLQDN